MGRGHMSYLIDELKGKLDGDFEQPEQWVCTDLVKVKKDAAGVGKNSYRIVFETTKSNFYFIYLNFFLNFLIFFLLKGKSINR